MTVIKLYWPILGQWCVYTESTSREQITKEYFPTRHISMSSCNAGSKNSIPSHSFSTHRTDCPSRATNFYWLSNSHRTPPYNILRFHPLCTVRRVSCSIEEAPLPTIYQLASLSLSLLAFEILFAFLRHRTRTRPVALYIQRHSAVLHPYTPQVYTAAGGGAYTTPSGPSQCITT